MSNRNRSTFTKKLLVLRHSYSSNPYNNTEQAETDKYNLQNLSLGRQKKKKNSRVQISGNLSHTKRGKRQGDHACVHVCAGAAYIQYIIYI